MSGMDMRKEQAVQVNEEIKNVNDECSKSDRISVDNISVLSNIYVVYIYWIFF